MTALLAVLRSQALWVLLSLSAGASAYVETASTAYEAPVTVVEATESEDTWNAIDDTSPARYAGKKHGDTAFIYQWTGSFALSAIRTGSNGEITISRKSHIGQEAFQGNLPEASIYSSPTLASNTSYLPIVVFAPGVESSVVGPVYAEPEPTIAPEPPSEDVACFTDIYQRTECARYSIAPDPAFWAGVEGVAWCESKYRVDVISPTDDWGFLQINRRYQEGRVHRNGYSMWDMLSLEPNIIVAYDLWSERGWQPWACRHYAGVW